MGTKNKQSRKANLKYRGTLAKSHKVKQSASDSVKSDSSISIAKNIVENRTSEFPKFYFSDTPVMYLENSESNPAHDHFSSLRKGTMPKQSKSLKSEINPTKINETNFNQREEFSENASFVQSIEEYVEISKKVKDFFQKLEGSK